MKTITLEEIYADPHVLDPLLETGEPVDIVCAEKTVGRLLPTASSNGPAEPLTSGPDFTRFLPAAGSAAEPFVPKKFEITDHRAWFLQTWGPDAFKSTRSVKDIINNARRPREFFRDE